MFKGYIRKFRVGQEIHHKDEGGRGGGKRYIIRRQGWGQERHHKEAGVGAKDTS